MRTKKQKHIYKYRMAIYDFMKKQGYGFAGKLLERPGQPPNALHECLERHGFKLQDLIVDGSGCHSPYPLYINTAGCTNIKINVLVYEDKFIVRYRTSSANLSWLPNWASAHSMESAYRESKPVVEMLNYMKARLEEEVPTV